MKYQLITIGSHGDVHPFIGLAKSLQNRGHTVKIATNPTFESLVNMAGIEFVPVGTKEQFAAWIANPDVWHPTKGGGAVLRGTSQTLRLAYDLARDFASTGTTIASTLSMGALCARETHQAKIVTVHLAPICIRSLHELPRLPLPIDLNFLPMFTRRQFWKGADRFSIDPAIAPAVNALRKELGLSPVSSILGKWMNSPDLTIGLWPDWFGKAQPDWPATTRLAGFPLYDEGDVTPLPEVVRAFLDAGTPPIAFTPGSAMKFGQDFFATAAESCRQLGRRGILLTRHGEQIPKDLPPGVIHVDYAPFGALLPKCAAVVHHGGIGTTSQALASGCPQLIMPMAHDQPDNASRVKKLGCGDFIWPRHFKPRKVTAKLNAVLAPLVKADAVEIRNRMKQSPAPLIHACDLIESV